MMGFCKEDLSNRFLKLAEPYSAILLFHLRGRKPNVVEMFLI